MLDPIASWRREPTLAPGETLELLGVIALAENEADARALALEMAAPGAFDAMREGAERRARAERDRCGLAPEQAAYLEAVLAQMLYGVSALRAPAEVFRRVRGTPDDLCVFGIPPDAPLVVIEEGPAAAALARELETAIAYWSGSGFAVRGLVLGGAAPASEAIAVAKSDADPRAVDSARACARLVLHDSWPDLGAAAPASRPACACPSRARDGALPPRAGGLRLGNGIGGFSDDGREYVIDVPGTPEAGGLPPMPWVNVLANPRFGTLVSERGAAHTWSRNSREHRLTPWSNDPILDPHGEALWVRDEDARAFWSPQPGPTPGGAPYEARHGFGTSSWRHRSHDLDQEVTTLVAADAPVKLTRLRLTNLAPYDSPALGLLLRATRARRAGRGHRARDASSRLRATAGRCSRATGWPASSPTGWPSRPSRRPRRGRGLRHGRPRPLPRRRRIGCLPPALVEDGDARRHERRAARSVLRAPACAST